MYNDLTTALDTPAGKEIEIEAKDVLIKPIDDLILVIDQMSKTLDDIKIPHIIKVCLINMSN